MYVANVCQMKSIYFLWTFCFSFLWFYHLSNSYKWRNNQFIWNYCSFCQKWSLENTVCDDSWSLLDFGISGGSSIWTQNCITQWTQRVTFRSVEEKQNITLCREIVTKLTKSQTISRPKSDKFVTSLFVFLCFTGSVFLVTVQHIPGKKYFELPVVLLGTGHIRSVTGF